MTKKILIKYHDAGIEHCKKIKVGDWIDLRAAETVSLSQFEYKEISLGVSMKLPRGYEAHILPRGSTYKKWGIIQANSQGIVDNSYSGDQDIWKFPAIALRNTTINKNDRICQFRIMKKMGRVRFILTQFLGRKNRGGFGSTGN
jgi:dUTP pyrophosphatase